MIHDSYLFDFQMVINEIREKIKKGKKMNCERLLADITETAELEDLPLYKEYLSLFDVWHTPRDVELHFPSELQNCKADFFILMIFVAASFSSKYDFEYDKETNLMSLSIMVEKDDGQLVVRRLHELSMPKIRRLFGIYLEEQLDLEGIRFKTEDGKKVIDEKRKMKLLVYQKKMKQLMNQMESSEILSDLDALLNS